MLCIDTSAKEFNFIWDYSQVLQEVLHRRTWHKCLGSPGIEPTCQTFDDGTHPIFQRREKPKVILHVRVEVGMVGTRHRYLPFLRVSNCIFPQKRRRGVMDQMWLKIVQYCFEVLHSGRLCDSVFLVQRKLKIRTGINVEIKFIRRKSGNEYGFYFVFRQPRG